MFYMSSFLLLTHLMNTVMYEVLWTYTPQFMSHRIRAKVLCVRLLQIKKIRHLSRSTKSEFSLNKSEYKEDR